MWIDPEDETPAPEGEAFTTDAPLTGDDDEPGGSGGTQEPPK